MKRTSNLMAICGIIMVGACAAAAENAITSIVSPTDTTAYTVGDTLRVEWTVDEAHLNNGFVVEISFNGGMKYLQVMMSAEELPTSTRKLEWVIPDTVQYWDSEVGGLVKLSTISEQVIIFVYEYDEEGLYSDVFSISSEETGVMPATVSARSSTLLNVTRSTSGTYMVVVPVDGTHTLTLVDSRGRQVRSRTAAGPAAYSLPVGHLAPGTYHMKVRTPEGTAARQISVTR